MKPAARRRKSTGPKVPAPSQGETAIADFAEDIGRLLGSAKAKASTWLYQRENIAKQLVGMRDSIGELLSRMGHEAAMAVPGRGRSKGSGKAAQRAGRDQASPSGRRPRKRRKMSAEARKRMSEAAKRRWAKVKASE
jgi:hypothetical protein